MPTKRQKGVKMADATYETVYILDSVVRIVLQVIGICALCVWIVMTKGVGK